MDRVTLLVLGALAAMPVVKGVSAEPVVARETVADWQPLIAEASRRFAIPEGWIRAVMQAESGGRTMLNGRPIVSRAGAMGLMQVMPETYAEMRRAHGLGPDPHDPRDNILAGTAYLRVLYDRYGYPGLFTAYNAGPGRYDDYLHRGRPLPAETRAYLAALTRTLVAPVIPSAVPSGTRLFVTLRTAMTPSAEDTESPATNALFVPLTTVPEVRR